MQDGRNKIRVNCRLCKNGNYPVTVKNNNKKRNFRRRCKPFIFDDGLYYKKTDSSKHLQVVKKGRQMTSLRAYMQHLDVSKNGSKLVCKVPIKTLKLFFITVKICRIFIGKEQNIFDCSRYYFCVIDDCQLIMSMYQVICVLFITCLSNMVRLIDLWFPNCTPRGLSR